ncbi:hydrophobic/amphiphilic exporter-1, HAE1 family [Singulisphaera sp. GP187]|uniref:efflux RND transporter permease subunit n=1 Tax=Singulisphaera sp. GP187 TaxID=1882752 RepID=UPI000927ADAF|nr:efflux RND transporter permease subunit [Singulisphaera sp. GP187]SIO66701.1 hydrophobic/amphiphilic exporter-1, HAE1 family [Singulisphaera sp. GP187]
MTLSDICIKRPVFTWVLIAVPVVLGLVSYGSLGVDLFPDVDFPVCTVTTVLPGAGVEEMETSVTKPIEDIINTVSGIEELRSTTMEGVSAITVQFDLSKNGNVGTQEVRDKVNTILAELPDGTEAPIIDKFDTGSMPVLTIAVSGKRDFREVTEIARKRIKERLETVNGVGAVTLVGGRVRAMNVVVDTDKLAGFGLSVDEVRMALTRQNLEVPGGRVDQGPRELVLRTLGRLNTAAEFNGLIVANRNGYPIRIRDIGRAEDAYEEPRTLAQLDGLSAVSLVVQKQSGSNTVKVSEDVKSRLETLRAALPADIVTEIIRDQSRFVKKSIEEVKFHLLLAGVLVSATILLFIRDWRTTVIATMAIPTSIIPTFMFMSYMGFTLNNITMLGLILAIGIVIDDAVVVHENIFRHMEEDGMDAMEASRIGTREIALPVLATSLSLIVIFVPIAFMGGIIGRFFSSFGLTVAFAVAMSLFVSFTLTPMLCSRFLKLEPGEAGHAGSKSGFIYRFVDGSYGMVLRGALRFKPLVVVMAILVIMSTVPIGKMMGMSLIPRDDQSEYEVTITTPEGYSLERTSRICNELEGRLRTLKGTKHLFTTIGQSSGGRVVKGQGDVTRATIYVSMDDLEEREYTQFAIQQEAREMLLDYPDLRASVNDVSAFQGGRRPQTFQVNLAGPDLNQLSKYADQLMRKLKEKPGLVDIDTSISLRKPEVQVIVDRERASDLGIPVGTIADTLRVLVGGMPISKFRDGDEQYDVWLRAEATERSSTANLYQLKLPSTTAGLVNLSSLAKLVDERGPTEIERLTRERIVTVLGNPEGIPLGEAVSRADAILKEMNLPKQYSYIFSGQAKTMGETGYYFMIAFGLSILFMYMILSAQFESWTQPISILMALPVTVPFGLLSLVLFRTPMDIYAMFGLFMLVGIVKKNGILQVDATNQLRDKGVPRREAIIEANHTRLRPILMTTVMLVAAMVPIALGQGPGAGARASMAKVIIGGQMLSLVLALLVTPVFYEIIDMWVNFTKRIGIRFSVQSNPVPRPYSGETPLELREASEKYV